MGSEDLAEMFEGGDLDDKLDGGSERVIFIDFGSVLTFLGGLPLNCFNSSISWPATGPCTVHIVMAGVLACTLGLEGQIN